MLVSLRFGSAPPAPSTGPVALHLLEECHERIRTHTEAARRLAGPEGRSVPAEQRIEAALALGRYFGKGLPLHVEDEDFSLAPRLRAKAPKDASPHLEQMISEHVETEELLARLLPLWQRLADGEAGEDLFLELAPDTLKLSTLLAGHLENEERFLFPLALQVLSAGELEQLATEIRARRQG